MDNNGEARGEDVVSGSTTSGASVAIAAVDRWSSDLYANVGPHMQTPAWNALQASVQNLKAALAAALA